jgi:phosphatidate phosphatase PAH1
MNNLIGKKVSVYRNLTKKCLSVMLDGKVIEYVDSIVLTAAKFTVRPAGRRKVLETRQKNVHAFITGVVSEVNPSSFDDSGMRPVTYNPYKYEKWTFKDNELERPILSEIVYVSTEKVLST